MSRAHPAKGYFSIGVFHAKKEVNIGTLWRSAFIMGASDIFTVGRRYKSQHSDTTKAWRHIPLRHWLEFYELYQSLPYGCQLVGVEIDDNAEDLTTFIHPERAVYLLGAEDHGLTDDAKECCHHIVTIPTINPYCLNVAVAGSIVMADRVMKAARNANKETDNE